MNGNVNFKPVFFIQDFSPNIGVTILKLNKAVENIRLEGIVSQNFNIGPSFGFMTQNWEIFFIICT